jgi:hypothetical protein
MVTTQHVEAGKVMGISSHDLLVLARTGYTDVLERVFV